MIHWTDTKTEHSYENIFWQILFKLWFTQAVANRIIIINICTVLLKLGLKHVKASAIIVALSSEKSNKLFLSSWEKKKSLQSQRIGMYFCSSKDSSEPTQKPEWLEQ